jgi:2-C-methyl-D-erythritol 2,4-cyclodiphosphate synthase
MSTLRIGQGWDIHRLVRDRDLIIGGVKIPSESGEDGHSDGDVLLHAVIDALLGALALGDIGTHFPPSDQRWKDADSAQLLERVMELVGEAGYRIVNLDCTVILQRVRLAPYREAIRKRMAELLGLSPDCVSLKAKTKEGVDAVGQGEAIEAQAVVLLEEADPGLWV